MSIWTLREEYPGPCLFRVLDILDSMPMERHGHAYGYCPRDRGQNYNTCIGNLTYHPWCALNIFSQQNVLKIYTDFLPCRAGCRCLTIFDLGFDTATDVHSTTHGMYYSVNDCNIYPIQGSDIETCLTWKATNMEKNLTRHWLAFLLSMYRLFSERRIYITEP